MTRPICLNLECMSSFKSIEHQKDRGFAERFKQLTEGGCLPLHLPNKGETVLSIVRHLTTRLHLPAYLTGRAQKIVAAENKKLRERNIEGDWIDGNKLAVQWMTQYNKGLILTVSDMKWSEVLAMKDLSFGEIAGLRAFKLDTNTHITARDNGHEILLVAQRGRKPGEPRMGGEMLLAPLGSDIQWTLATNGTIDADVLESAGRDNAWMVNSFKEFGEELGVEGDIRIRYLGTMVDPHMFTGAVGICGVIETSLTPMQIDRRRSEARDGSEVAALDVVPVDKESVAAYLRNGRDNMVPQLITGLLLLGYERWGEDFLRLAD